MNPFRLNLHLLTMPFMLSLPMKLFGLDPQILKLVEEMAELTTALLHYRKRKCSIKDVQEEFADVLNMLAQVVPEFDAREIEAIRMYKMHRFVRDHFDQLKDLVVPVLEKEGNAISG